MPQSDDLSTFLDEMPDELNKDHFPVLKELKEILQKYWKYYAQHPDVIDCYNCQEEIKVLEAYISVVGDILKHLEQTGTDLDSWDLFQCEGRWNWVKSKMDPLISSHEEAKKLEAQAAEELAAEKITPHEVREARTHRMEAQVLRSQAEAIGALPYDFFLTWDEDADAIAEYTPSGMNLRTSTLRDRLEARYHKRRFKQKRSLHTRQDRAQLARKGLRPDGRSHPIRDDQSQAGPENGPVGKVVGMRGFQLVQDDATRRRLGDTLPVHQVETVAIGSPMPAMAAPALGGLALGLVAAAAYLLKRFRQLPRKTKNASEDP